MSLEQVVAEEKRANYYLFYSNRNQGNLKNAIVLIRHFKFFCCKIKIKILKLVEPLANKFAVFNL